MKVFIKYFARYRELLDCSEETLDLPEGYRLLDLQTLLVERGHAWKQVFVDNDQLLIAVNHELVNPEYCIKDQDEIAFYPPVTGG